MNILHLNTNTNGGAAKACIRLHQGLLNNETDSELLVLTGKKGIPHIHFLWDKYPAAVQHLLEIRHRLKVRKLRKTLPNAGYYPLRTYQPWYDPCEHASWKTAELIHAHWIAEFADIPILMKKIQKPMVWTLHDELPYSGGYHYQSGTSITPIQDRLQKGLGILEKSYSGKNINWVAPSNWIKDQAVKSPFIDQSRVTVIPNGVDTEVFKYEGPERLRKKLKWKDGVFTFLFVAGWLDVPIKGFDLAIEAFLELFRQETKKDLQLVVVGRHMNKVLTHSGIRYVGYCESDQELAHYYGAADVLLCPSRIDNYPNTILESQACGTPVIGFEVGGIPEMIVNGESGWLAGQPEAESLLKVMKSSLRQVPLLAPEQLSRRTIEKHNLDKLAENHLSLYHDILG